MAGRGRGRGRGILIKQLDEPSAPGNKKKISIDDVSLALKNISLEPTKQELDDFEKLVADYSSDDTHFPEVVRIVYGRCFIDRDFAKTAALVCNKLSSLQNMKFRTAVLKIIQSDFSVREELRTSSTDKFLAFISFLCQVFAILKTTTGTPFSVLASPILDCLEMIVAEGSEEEIECCSLQLQCIGSMLEANNTEKTIKFLASVRRRIVQSSDMRIRSMLLEILEIALNKWNPLSIAISHVYSELHEESLINGS